MEHTKEIIITVVSRTVKRYLELVQAGKNARIQNLEDTGPGEEDICSSSAR